MAIKAAEFDDLLKVFLRLAALMLPDSDIAEDIKRWQTEFTPSQLRQGLQDALGDLAEVGFDLSPDERQRIDDIMKAEALMTLTELQVRHGKRIKRLLKKKKLVHEEDAIALKGYLDSDLLDERDAETAMQLIESFGS